MAVDINHDPDLEWLDHVPPVGLVVAPTLLKELGLIPSRQSAIQTGEVAEIVGDDLATPALSDPWTFIEKVLGWEARHVAGSPGGPPIPDEMMVALPEHGTTLAPTWAVAELGEGERRWQLLVRVEARGVDPDGRNALDGWEATPHQRFERLLRDTGVFAGLLISEREERKDGQVRTYPEFRLIYAPRGETSGHQSFPIRPMALVSGRPMLGGLKLLLDRFRLFSDGDDRRLPALLKRSRDAQALVSTALAEQVLGALHELLRGLDAAEPELVRELCTAHPEHLYEGLLTVLMRLVFVLYAEDRDLLPSLPGARAREVYETSYSVRGLYAKLTEDATLNPDTMDERRGGWGGLLALVRMIHKGHRTGFVQARGGKLFDPDEFPFLEGRSAKDDAPRILHVSDGCLLRILEGLMTIKLRGANRERLSYRTLDVEQIGSVYETVMGFTAEAASSRVLAIKAGKNNKTPVFVALDDLLAKKGKDRIKSLKEDAGRTLTAAQAKSVEAAKTVEDLAAALDNIVDERGSPKKRIAPAGTPILQPTDERRRTGSHYTPRSLTAPIVKHALEPAFARLGPDATPEQVLELKVCDPAMGSGAFLVEACRALGERLVAAWARWPDKRPKIPADEDEELHARRLVAQRCLYGVDKNPRAVDLARLSLWLATLARDHEFTFLDHALKCGDSLVGLTTAQIAAANWDESKPGLPLFRQLVRDSVAKAMKGRAEIQNAPDDTMRAIQEARHRNLELEVSPIRTMGDAVISAFFAADKPKARERARAEVESHISGMPPRWDLLEAAVAALRGSEHGITPFHWQVEFPEVFARDNGGFDAIVGNPPFLSGSRTSQIFGASYFQFLLSRFSESKHQCDLVAFFVRQSFDILRNGGACGLVATNTLAQGDTRESSLRWVLRNGGNIYRVKKRLRWPGEAAVVVSVVHFGKHVTAESYFDDRIVDRISAYLVAGNYDDSPLALADSPYYSKGSQIYGQGFVFDDKDSKANPVSAMDDIRMSEVEFAHVFELFGGVDLNQQPQLHAEKWVINVSEFSDEAALKKLPLLHKLISDKVRPEREKLPDNANNKPLKKRWWAYQAPRPELYRRLSARQFCLAHAEISPHLAFRRVPTGPVYIKTAILIDVEAFAGFAALQSRSHELWARFFSSSMKDDLRYTPSDCFRTFPFPTNFETNPILEAAGEAYHVFRAQLMIHRNEGLTKAYNGFHARGENGGDIARLRTLHHEMDVAVLRAYGWDDLATRAAPEFIEQDADEGKTPKTRLDWPSDFKDEVLARLLALNATRAAEERAAGLVAADEGDDDEIDEGEVE
ncbi:N-6 DNA methylase [Aquabacter sp. L1I39]|uniref:Eco57I restriction-modification methylase domain-containing protein n=1 Tax=Aquabacter sp. L1I39 TaxID=2820278 RepID=UPI001AD9F713|nr:DNA methyltransferase [Aquabacter sp. L1I39]QTL04820.1 N-6 DNA methylase [Aquabacter sp. L1I39]